MFTRWNKMNPEPLKKIYNFRTGEPPTNDWWYSEEQIKAACKWFDIWIKLRLSIRPIIDYEEVQPIFKKAFEEVYKK